MIWSAGILPAKAALQPNVRLKIDFRMLRIRCRQDACAPYFPQVSPSTRVPYSMKTLLFILLLSTLTLAQHKENSVCSEPAKRTPLTRPQPVLTICNQGRGMTALPALRLYLRVFADGTAEYEENPSWKENVAGMDNFRLVKRAFKTSAAQVEEIKRLGAEDDFLSAKGDYPVFRIWTDSGLETTVIFNWESIHKRTMLKNFQLGDKDNEKNYPASLVALLRVADEVRNSKGPKPVTPVPLEYKGFLQVGKAYRGRVNFGDAYGMRLTPAPKLPFHHSVLYTWTNVKDFPELDPDKDFGVRTIVFRVMDKKIEPLRKNQWTTAFTIEIVRVE